MPAATQSVVTGVFHLFDIPAKAFVFVDDAFQLQHVLDAFEQFRFVDRFREKVIRTGGHGPFDISQLIQSGDHQNHDPFIGGIGFDFFADFEPAQLGHHHIQEDQVGLEGDDFFKRIASIDRDGRIAVDAGQIGLEQFAVRFVVVSNQDTARSSPTWMMAWRVSSSISRVESCTAPARRMASIIRSKTDSTTKTSFSAMQSKLLS